MASRRQWFTEAFLPEVLKTLRRRRMILLLDDIHILQQASSQSILPTDTLTFLANSLPEVAEIICTLSVDYEDQLLNYAPLIHTDDIYRIDVLTLEDVSELLRNTVNTPITDDAIAEFYNMSGGEPHLIQIGLRNLPPDHTLPYTPQQINQIFTSGYPESLKYLHMRWEKLDAEEKIILQAMAARYIEDPLSPVNIVALEKWLVETDVPLDNTTINTAVRSLEYQELIMGDAADLKFRSRLMRRWVIEHGEFQGKPVESEQTRTDSENIIPWGLVIAATFVLVIIILVVGSTFNNTDNAEPVPTITLDSSQ